jgi:hypothetical protein
VRRCYKRLFWLTWGITIPRGGRGSERDGQRMSWRRYRWPSRAITANDAVRLAQISRIPRSVGQRTNPLAFVAILHKINQSPFERGGGRWQGPAGVGRVSAPDRSGSRGQPLSAQQSASWSGTNRTGQHRVDSATFRSRPIGPPCHDLPPVEPSSHFRSRGAALDDRSPCGSPASRWEVTEPPRLRYTVEAASAGRRANPPAAMESSVPREDYLFERASIVESTTSAAIGHEIARIQTPE